MTEITQLLERATQGESEASHQLIPLIYSQLHAIAQRQLGHESKLLTLSTTAVVHEAYLALFSGTELKWRDRAQFFTYAATTMRNILIDHTRRRLASKRGGQANQMDIVEIAIGADAHCVDLLALDQALTQMATDYPRLVRVVELRFFAGLSVKDTATTLGIDPRTVERDWRKARAFINQHMGRAI